jgi:hypothetical protein
MQIADIKIYASLIAPPWPSKTLRGTHNPCRGVVCRGQMNSTSSVFFDIFSIFSTFSVFFRHFQYFFRHFQYFFGHFQYFFRHFLFFRHFQYFFDIFSIFSTFSAFFWHLHFRHCSIAPLLADCLINSPFLSRVRVTIFFFAKSGAHSISFGGEDWVF